MAKAKVEGIDDMLDEEVIDFAAPEDPIPKAPNPSKQMVRVRWDSSVPGKLDYKLKHRADTFEAPEVWVRVNEASLTRL